MRGLVRAAAAWVALVLAGCAAAPSSGDRVILLPNAGGGVGAIAVIQNDRETLLTAPYTSATLDRRGSVHAEQLEAADVRSRYARELSALPPRPVTYFLYFEPDSPLPTLASQRAAGPILEEIARRPAVEVRLIGHSDKQGEDAHNDTLSLTRAMWVRTRLIALGVSGFRIDIDAEGERRPAIATPDGVDEARNRRVEIRAR
ncbi:MAG: OmpA family protein [Panacagrimonas sp.]|jgi:outer membrane protein OmpA-like peptidoglycan-associated protein|nr:OmpA family protein [Panacagrimonas sp.]MCC2656444.1 OmpA family protein [Panacagrimonas sp.]